MSLEAMYMTHTTNQHVIRGYVHDTYDRTTCHYRLCTGHIRQNDMSSQAMYMTHTTERHVITGYVQDTYDKPTCHYRLCPGHIQQKGMSLLASTTLKVLNIAMMVIFFMSLVQLFICFKVVIHSRGDQHE